MDAGLARLGPGDHLRQRCTVSVWLGGARRVRGCLGPRPVLYGSHTTNSATSRAAYLHAVSFLYGLPCWGLIESV
jgi:hypothetical protein